MIKKLNKKNNKTGSVTNFSFYRVTRMLSFFFLLFFIFYDSIFSFGADNGAELYLSQSEEAIKGVYISMLEADREGADVDVYVSIINHEIIHLEEEWNAYYLGDHSRVNKIAQDIMATSMAVQQEIVSISSIAKHDRKIRYDYMIYSYGRNIFIINIIIYISWNIFKLNYRKRIVGLKPEVIIDEVK
jgi:hypothetical protein